MVIQTINENYRVIRTLHATAPIQAYLCFMEGECRNQKYLVMGIMEPELSRNMLVCFMDLMDHRETSDFIGSFTREGCVWLIFRFYDYPLFSDRVKENLLLRERLDFGKSLLERLLGQNLPAYLEYEALNPENMTASDSGDIYFNYLLLEPEMFFKCGRTCVQERLGAAFTQLFSIELKENISQNLTSYIKKLNQGDFEGKTEIYQEYCILYEDLRNRQDQGKLQKKGYLVRLWEKLVLLFGILIKIVCGLFLAVLAGLLVYVCIMPDAAPADRFRFQSIGTLSLYAADSKEQIKETNDTQEDTPLLEEGPETEAPIEIQDDQGDETEQNGPQEFGGTRNHGTKSFEVGSRWGTTACH